MTLAYLLCYQLYGPIPFGFHLLNLVLHAAVVLLVFAVTRRLFGDHLPALLAAGLFALHPIHTESVAWIAGITDLELSFFFLLTFLLYLRLGDRPAISSTAQTGLLLAYALALLSKEQALVLPFLAAVYEHFYRPERATRRSEPNYRATRRCSCSPLPTSASASSRSAASPHPFRGPISHGSRLLSARLP